MTARGTCALDAVLAGVASAGGVGGMVRRGGRGAWWRTIESEGFGGSLADPYPLQAKIARRAYGFLGLLAR